MGGKGSGGTPRFNHLRPEILFRLELGQTLTSICEIDGFPTPDLVLKWAREDTVFDSQYLRAREIGYAMMADIILDIADTETDPVLARNRVETRKWLMSKALPKVYGDRLDVQHSGTIEHKLAPREALEAKLVDLAAKRKLAIDVDSEDVP